MQAMARTATRKLLPTEVRPRISPRSQDEASSITGSPLGSRNHPPPANLSIPRVAKRAETSAWAAVRKLIATVSARSIAGHADEAELTEKATIGGSADTEMTEVAVNPIRFPASARVTTATPAG